MDILLSRIIGLLGLFLFVLFLYMMSINVYTYKDKNFCETNYSTAIAAKELEHKQIHFF